MCGPWGDSTCPYHSTVIPLVYTFNNQSTARPTAMRLSLYPTEETGGSRPAGGLDQGLLSQTKKGIQHLYIRHDNNDVMFHFHCLIIYAQAHGCVRQSSEMSFFIHDNNP